MGWIFRVERKLGRNFGITNIMIYITATMLALYALWRVAMPGLYGLIWFDRELILAGEFWRVISFLLFVPSPWASELTILIGLFFAYSIGTSLERTWGKTLFNMYLILGAIGSIIAGFISGYATTFYISLSLLLAFCYLNPNATIMLFMILPVKAKFIAIANWVLYMWLFIQGSFGTRMSIIFSLINFFLFFGPNIYRAMRQNYNVARRRREYQKSWRDQDHWR